MVPTVALWHLRKTRVRAFLSVVGGGKGEGEEEAQAGMCGGNAVRVFVGTILEQEIKTTNWTKPK